MVFKHHVQLPWHSSLLVINEAFSSPTLIKNWAKDSYMIKWYNVNDGIQIQDFPVTVILICTFFLDPFGGDPFKEADPFSTSSEDFFKKPSKPDTFSHPDPFSKSATLPSKVPRKPTTSHYSPYSLTYFSTISFLLSCRVIIFQVMTPSAPLAPNQKAKVCRLHVSLTYFAES